MPIKKKCQPKYRLPVLNWQAMKPMQVKGTVFADLDDERLYKVSIIFTPCLLKVIESNVGMKIT